MLLEAAELAEREAPRPAVDAVAVGAHRGADVAAADGLGVEDAALAAARAESEGHVGVFF